MKLAPDLSLPLSAVTEKLAFLGRTGSGKTYAAQLLAECMLTVNAQVVVLDPVGIWYALRLDADGKSPGFPIPVFGGLRGDVPLEPSGGALIANLIVDRGISAVIDVSQFEHDTDKARFARGFADRFFFRKKADPSAVHIFLEECQEFIPQNPTSGEAQMLHAFTRMLKIGRNFGIGSSMLSQRPQEVNKKCLNLAEILFAFQLTGPHERKTIEGWIADKGIDEDIAGELPKLEIGHPHVWSPALLKISRVVSINRKSTFDASSTPKVGKRTIARELSPIDMERLRSEMAATIERANAEDPKFLRARIVHLEKLLKRNKTIPAVIESEMINRAETVWREEKAKLSIEIVALNATLKAVCTELDAVEGAFKRVRMHANLRSGPEPMTTTVTIPRVRPKNNPSLTPPSFIVTPTESAIARTRSVDAELGRMPRAFLTALAQWGPMTRGRLLVMTRYRSSGTTSSAFANMIRSDLVTLRDGLMSISPEGRLRLGNYEPLPQGRELREKILADSGPMARAFMGQLFEAFPDAVPKNKLLELTGYKSSGTTSSEFRRLVVMGYATKSDRGCLCAAATLMNDDPTV